MYTVNDIITYILSFFFEGVKKDIEIESSINKIFLKEEDYILDEYNTCMHAQFNL
jgi:hypothetical protein